MLRGQLTAFFMFDVADAIDLAVVRGLIDATVATRLSTRPATPTYLQYQQPPLTFDGAALGLSEVEGFRTRAKAFDYGVLSIALTRELPESWESVLVAGFECQENPRLPEAAERVCRQLLTRISAAVDRPRDTFLTEDYFVFTLLTDPAGPASDELLASHGADIAQLLRGERESLSGQEREEVLRHRISYLRDRRGHSHVEQRVRLRHAGRRRRGARDPGVHQLTTARVQVPTISCSMPNCRESTPACSAAAGGRRRSAGAIRAPRARCTRCSST